MKISKKYPIYSLLVFAMVVSSFTVSEGKKRGPVPKYQGETEIPGIESDVTVIRDQRGMPHIYASNEHDLYYVTGFITAGERLWHMDLLRRIFSGRLSEIFGKKYVETDLIYRYLEIPAKSAMVIKNQDKIILQCLEAYTEGVNYYIASAGKNLPCEFRILSYVPEPWRVEDIAGMIGFMSWSLSELDFRSELFTYKLLEKVGYGKAASLILADAPAENPVYPDIRILEQVIKEAEAFISGADKLKDLAIIPYPASNNWAVSGKRSSTGKPLFSNDMHLMINSPGIWMQMHQVVPGKLNVTGVMVPGEPFIIAGHNEKIAWGMTNMMTDNIDFYIEKIDENNRNRYFFNGDWRDMKIRDEIINIKGGKRQTFRVGSTHRGPLISELGNIKDCALSMRWAGKDTSDEIRTCYYINRAENWEEFKSALTTFRSLSQNFAYADTEGNIGLISAGGIPVRKNPASLTRDGQSDEFDWQGYLPFEKLPFSYNPANGYISSANNQTADSGYPYYITNHFANPYRINRIREMIEGKDLLGIDDFKMMINDQHSNCAAHLVPYILKLEEQSDKLSKIEKEALQAIKGWDFNMDRNLVQPLIFESFRLRLGRDILADELGELIDEVCVLTADKYMHYVADKGTGEYVDNVNTPVIETIDDIVQLSFKESIQSLSKKYGRDINKWKWGNSHRLALEHPLGRNKILNCLYKFNSEDYAVGGSDHTVSMFGSYTPGSKVNVGASQKHIFNTANWDESYSVIPSGQSGIPGSEFYLSQTRTYIDGGFYNDYFSEKAVKENARYILVLKKK